MTVVAWTFSAIADVEMIHRYIENFNPYAARAVAAQIIEAGNGLAVSPSSGRYRSRPVPGPRRRAITLTRPYIIHYQLSRATVLILRVRHRARQSPARR